MQDIRTPWFRQFWPWFLLALPAAVVIAGFITLYIAIRHADSPVRDEYAKAGLALRRDTAQDHAAALLGLSAQLGFAGRHAGAAVAVSLDGRLVEVPDALELQFIHPLDESGDFTVTLIRDGERYAGTLPRAAPGHWTVELHATSAPWRLRGELADDAAALALTTESRPQ